MCRNYPQLSTFDITKNGIMSQVEQIVPYGMYQFKTKGKRWPKSIEIIRCDGCEEEIRKGDKYFANTDWHFCWNCYDVLPHYADR